MTGRRTVLGPVALVLALLAGAGCSAEDPDDPEEPDGTTAATDLTTPGSTLALGESATLPVNGGLAVVELTVTEVEQGTSAQLRAIDLEQAAERTPYYVRLEATVVSGDTGSSYVPTLDLMASADGTAAPNLAFGGPFPPCELDGFGSQAAPGTTLTTCVPFLVPRGGPPVDEVSFSDNDDYSAAADAEVVWSGLSAAP